MRLSKNSSFRIELVVTGAMEALGLSSMLYAIADHLGAAWHWLAG